MLVNNHRQDGDKVYADLLNRVRIGKPNEEDLNLLRTRVRLEGHPDLPDEALRVMSTNKEVNKYNDRRLTQVREEEHVFEAIARSRTQKKLKPMTDKTGAIKGTQLQKTLKLKIGAKVMMTANVATTDSLTNGSFGEVVEFERDEGGKISAVLVQFVEEKSGREMRKTRPDIQKKYPGKNITAVKRYHQEYTLTGRAKSGSATATAIQFPLRLAFAATAHKLQGATVKKPNCLVVDLRSKLQAAQGYVMISRVQESKQLFILGHLPQDKLFASPEALQELERMEKIAINNRMKEEKAIISSINIYSLKKNFEDMKASAKIRTSEVICIQETWFEPEQDISHDFQIIGFNVHFASVGRGKGIATYFTNSFIIEKDIVQPTYQMTKIVSEDKEIINVYRSTNAPVNFLVDLKSLINDDRITYIVGDFNICHKTEKTNKVVQHLKDTGFR